MPPDAPENRREEEESSQNELPSTQDSGESTRKQLQSTRACGKSTRDRLQCSNVCGKSTQKQLPRTENNLPRIPDALQSTRDNGQSTKGQLQSTQDRLPQTQKQLPSTCVDGTCSENSGTSADDWRQSSSVPRTSADNGGGSGKILSAERDAELLQLIKSGDDRTFSEALGQLMREHRKPVRRWFSGKFGDIVPLAELDDMTQQFYCRLWETRARSISKSMTGYLIQKIGHDCVSYMRFKGTAYKNDPEYYEQLFHFTIYLD